MVIMGMLYLLLPQDHNGKDEAGRNIVAFNKSIPKNRHLQRTDG